MSAPCFEVRRLDGRSDAQVVIDLVKDREPGEIVTYEELSVALAASSQRTDYGRPEASRAVRSAAVRLLRDHLKALHPVPMVGYRIAKAHEHVVLANGRKRRANVQMLRGLQTLQHVRWDEMSSAQREAHMGTLNLVAALYQQQRMLEARQTRVEHLVRSMRPPREE